MMDNVAPVAASVSKTNETREQMALLLLRAVVALPGAGSALALMLSFIFDPAAVGAGRHLGPFAALATPCSGCGLCGMSRAFSCLSHGRLDAALAYNSAALVVYIAVWSLLLASLFGLRSLARRPPRFFPEHP